MVMGGRLEPGEGKGRWAPSSALRASYPVDPNDPPAWGQQGHQIVPQLQVPEKHHQMTREKRSCHELGPFWVNGDWGGSLPLFFVLFLLKKFFFWPRFKYCKKVRVSYIFKCDTVFSS